MRRSRPAAENAEIVEVRPEARRAALEVALDAILQLRRSRGLALVAKLRLRQAQLLGTLGEGRLQRGDHSVAARHELGPEPTDLLVPGGERIAGRDALRHAPQRGVPLADRRAVFGRETAPRRR